MPVYVPIQVASITDTTGNITPLWLRYKDADELIHKATVTVRTRKENMTWLTYACWLLEDGIKSPVELSYHIREHRWTMQRI